MKLKFSLNHSHLLQKPFYFFTGIVTKALNHYLEFYSSAPDSHEQWPAPEYFQTGDGRRLPVFSDYRYSVKPGWKYFPALTALHLLIQKGLANKRVQGFFKDAIGTRALGRSLSEIDDVSRSATMQQRDLFLSESLEPSFRPTIIPAGHEIRSQVKVIRKSHKVLFSKLKSFGVDFPAAESSKILEIGYISGGYSLFAFESLGFQTFGIDNYYGDDAKRNSIPQYISTQLSSQVDFRLGDITHTTDFENDEMDIVYSASVLEHLSSLPRALKEMSRILKPGGLMIHNYNPFYCPNGGHALGILDCPWGHVRVSDKDYLRYMDELRPFETNTAKHWISHSLNKLSIQQLQKELVRRGFKILFWQQHAAPIFQQCDLTPEIMQECFALHPHIGLADLITSTASFAARKVAGKG